MKKVVIAVDSFKGCLASAEAGEAAAAGIRGVFPECEVCCVAVADGGEGMLDVLVAAAGGKYVPVRAHGPLMEMRSARYGISADGKTAWIEMASVSGLPLVPVEKRDPMLTTTYGVGEMIRDALERGCRDFVIGIGGSATNDAGLGMLQALGFRFLDRSGNILGTGGRVMARIVSIDTAFVHPALKDSRFTVACDVRNPFCGPQGAAFVFAPQKGADRSTVNELDTGMRALAGVILRFTGKDISGYPGAGAAGGMGGGLLAFLNAELKPGISLLLEASGFFEKLKDADLVITGEGKADRQTAMGKVPSGVLEEARKRQIPVILLAGGMEDADELNRAGFQGVFSIVPGPVSLEKAMDPDFARANIRRVTEQLCRVIRSFKSQI